MKKRVTLLLLMLVASMVFVASVGAYAKFELLEKLEIETEENIISLPFVLIADKQLRYSVETGIEELRNPPPATEPDSLAAPEGTEASAPEELPEVTDAPVLETQAPETEPPETEPELVYTPVDESWFDDALFIGESRTLGLKGMGRLGKADYFCAGSLSVFAVMDIRSSDVGFYNQTLGSLLSNKTYGKIYIHLGINELGGGSMDNIIAQYQKLIDMIREKQPDAYIILQGIMSVSKGYAMNPKFSLENIQELNSRIEALAVDEHFRYIDVNEWLADEEGYLRDEMTHDGCHLYGSGYAEWGQWLLENAGWLGIP